MPRSRVARHERNPKTAVKPQQKFQHEREREPIQPLTDNQSIYLRILRQNAEQVIVLGPAGTGKTYIAGSYAADKLRKREVRKIIICRPNIPNGRTLGFDPGTEQEKIAPWARPLTDTIKERMGAGAFDIAVHNGDIEIAPMEKIRGRTFKDCIVILDEAQNTTVDEIKTFLTRIGENTQVIVNGDISQSDIKVGSGLAKVIHIIKSHGLPVPIIEFTLDDIVRSGVCEMWVRAFHKERL